MPPNLKLGAVFPAQADPAELPAFAEQLEQLGFDALWLIEDCFLSGGLTMAASALARTDSLVVGVGLLPAPVRNPAVAAMEIATLARMHPGRFQVAFGHGVKEWMEQIGALPARRLQALGEVVGAVRELLGGERVTVSGSHVRLDGVALDHPPSITPPVLIGTTGPRGLALAAQVADGILLPEGCGPEFVSEAIEQAGGPERLRRVVYSWFSFDEDPERAAERLLPAIDRWLDWELFPGPRRSAGVEQAPPAGDPARLALTRTICVCGDARQCAAAVGRYAAAGAETLVLAPPPDSYGAQLRAFAEQVLPGLRSAG